MSIPVICDRCRATGIAGESDFSHLGDLLEFDPVARKTRRVDGWSPDKQRAFIAALSATGSKRRAAQSIGMATFGVDQLLKSDGSGSFRCAFDRAMAIAERNGAMKIAQGVADAAARNAVLASNRASTALTPPSRLRGLALPGMPDDPDAFARALEEGRDRISKKLLGARRLYLQEISDSPGKRAAFEILTELPIDWDKARDLQPQPDEPFKSVNQHQPDMILTAESGWSFGDIGYGADRKAEMRRTLDEHRAKEGLDPIEWEEE